MYANSAIRSIPMLLVAACCFLSASDSFAITQVNIAGYSNCMYFWNGEWGYSWDGKLLFTDGYLENDSEVAATVACPVFTKVGVGGMDPDDIYDVTVYVIGNANAISGKLCFYNKYSSGSCGASDSETSTSGTYLALFPPSGTYSAASYRAKFYVTMGAEYSGQNTRIYSYKVWKN